MFNSFTGFKGFKAFKGFKGFTGFKGFNGSQHLLFLVYFFFRNLLTTSANEAPANTEPTPQIETLQKTPAINFSKINVPTKDGLQ